MPFVTMQFPPILENTGNKYPRPRDTHNTLPDFLTSKAVL